MSVQDRRNIAKILNKTNFRLMTWYFSPKESAASGLKRFKLAYKMPMQSTGREKFTAYVYFKTEMYDEENPWSDDSSEYEDLADFYDEEDDNAEEAKGKEIKDNKSDSDSSSSETELARTPQPKSRNKKVVEKAARKAAASVNQKKEPSKKK